jgi:flagellar hook assembly protein FlgD
LSAGPHETAWNGQDVSGRAAASGIYIYRLVAGKETISRKMVLLR